MAWYDFLKKETVTKKEAHVISFNNDAKVNYTEQFTGIVERKYPTWWKKDIGEAHPFDPRLTEVLYKKFGLVTGVIDKYVDYIWGSGIYVTCDEPNGDKAVKIINDFLRDINFSTIGRAWVKEALLKPGGYLELGGNVKEGEIKGVKVLDGKYMYIRRNEYGEILGYTQYIGGFDKYNPKKSVPFEPFNIASLHLNKVGDSPYGLGIVYPACSKIDQLLGLEKDMHTIVKRKANNPLHIKIGTPEIPPSTGDISAVRNELETLTPKTEWVTDALWDIKSIDTGDISGKYDTILKHDIDMLIFTFQVPEVLLGRGSIPEGLAQVQADAFERRIASFQEEIEKVMEEDIFKRVLNANGLDMHVEVNWGEPSTTQKNNEISKIQTLLTITELNPALRFELEKRLANLFDIDEKILDDAEETRQQMMDDEQEVEQPEVPGQKNLQANTDKIKLLKELLLNDNLSPEVRCNIEDELQRLLDIHGSENTVIAPQVEISISEQGVSDFSTEKSPLFKDMSDTPDPFNEEASINEWLGFNYREFLAFIRDRISQDDFNQIKATDSLDIEAGKLTSVQVDALKEVLDEGFKKGMSIKEIANKIREDVSPKDLLAVENGEIIKDSNGFPQLKISAEKRPLMIARSETTRLAAEGAIKFYEYKGFTKYRWVSAAYSSCPECDSLNGKIYGINELDESPPLHPNCRCNVVPVTELD